MSLHFQIRVISFILTNMLSFYVKNDRSKEIRYENLDIRKMELLQINPNAVFVEYISYSTYLAYG